MHINSNSISTKISNNNLNKNSKIHFNSNISNSNTYDYNNKKSEPVLQDFSSIDFDEIAEKAISAVKIGITLPRDYKLDREIEKAGGLNTRDAVVAAARYLSETEKIPYYWGGKRNKYGVDPEWGVEKELVYPGTEMQPQGGSYPYGLDCSGFVSWAITNGGYNMPSTYTENYWPYATIYNYDLDNLKSGVIKAGDLLYREGHIAIITDLNLEKGTIKVAEEKGAEYGMVVTEMKFEDFLNSNHYTHIYSMEDFYNNPNNYIDPKKL